MSEIAPYEPTFAATREPRIGNLNRSDVQFVGELARTVAGTEFVKRELRGNVPAIIAAMLYGNALGIDPMIALQSIHMVDGKPTMDASLVSARVRQAGHSMTWEEIHGDGAVVGFTVHGKRKDSGDEGSFTFTVKDAQRAGLVRQGSGWTKYPASMCWARAVTQLARMLFSDVFLGAVYTPEEMGAPSAGEPGGGSGEPLHAADTPSAEEPQAQATGRDIANPPGPSLDGLGEPSSSAEFDGPDVPFMPDSSAGAVDEVSTSEAREAPAEELPRTGYMKAERGGGGTDRVGGVETFPGGDFKEWAKPWLIDEVERDRIFDTRGFDQTVFEQWDKHRKDANAAANLVREQDDKDVLILWADREARTRARKNVFAVFTRRLEKLGGGPEVASSGGPGRAEEASTPTAAESAPTAAEPPVSLEDAIMADVEDELDKQPLPETLQAVTALARLRAALHFIAENPTSVPKPLVWTEPKVLAGVAGMGWGKYDALADVPEEDLVEVWKLIPEGVRLHIEGCDYETVVKMGDSLGGDGT